MRMTLNTIAILTVACGLGFSLAYADPVDHISDFNGSFLPAAGDAKPAVALKTPTGCTAFNVEYPQPKKKMDISVADFGASPRLADNTVAFNKAVAHCRKTGASRLTVPRGVYRFVSENFIVFDKFSDFEFDGQGSTFIFHQSKVRGSFMSIVNCERCLFKNFNIDWDWDKDPLASLVKTVAVAPSGDYADFEFIKYTDFPRKDLRVVDVHQMDEQTMSVGCEDAGRAFFTTIPGVNPVPKTEWLSHNVLRVYSDSNRNRLNKFKVGRLFLMRHYYFDMYSAISTKNNAQLTLSDINIYSAPGMGIRAEGTQHHWQLLNVNIVKPPEAAWRPITTTADGLHSKQSLGYFKMEGCELSFCGDDSINIHDSAGFGVKTAENIITAQNVKRSMLDDLTIGDPLEFRNPDYSPTGVTAQIVKIEKIVRPSHPNQLRITVSTPVPGRQGDCFVYFNRRYDSSNILIRNCRFHDGRGRGMLLHPWNITVENNHFFHTERSAIMIMCGYANTWSEGYGASNIVIKNNRFDTISPLKEREMFPVIYISVYMKTDPSEEKTSFPILQNILVQGNDFINCPGAMVYACSVKNLIVRDNTIKNTVPRKADFYYRGTIGTKYSSEIYVTGNYWYESKLMPWPGIFYDSQTSQNIYCWNNQIINKR